MNKRSISCRPVFLLLVALLFFCIVTRFATTAQTTQAAQQGISLFQSAQEDWDNQRWEQAVGKYKKFVEQFPAHPKAAESHFQIGYYLSYVAPPEEAMAEYENAIALAPGSHEAHESKIGIAALKIWLQQYEEAYDLYRQVIRETQDWSTIKECTFLMKEVGRQMGLQKLPDQRIGMMDCGPKALALILKKRRVSASDEEVQRLVKMQSGGATMEQLKEAAQSKGVRAWGVKLNADQLNAIPKPFIAHIRPNHYVVVTGVSDGRVEFTDPHRGETYRTNDRFEKIWQGHALIFAKAVPPKLRAQLLTKAEMEGIRGGHHLHGRNFGPPDGNPATRYEEDPSQCPLPGLPRWSVNLSNFNFLVQDTDFSYSGRGPRVELTRTYNADDPRESAFGRSWTFNYDVFLVVNPNGSVDIKRESGKVDNFVPRGDGTFDPPRWVHDQLIRNADGTYTLTIKRTRLKQDFNVQGKLARATDRNGNSFTLQYDVTNRLVSVTDAVGRVTRFNHNAAGKISEVVDPIQRRATFSYDSNNNLVSTVDMAGNLVNYTYDSNSYMTSIKTPKAPTPTQIVYGTTAFFTEFPFVLKDVIDPSGNTTHFDTDCCIAWVVDARGNRTFYFNNVNAETTEITDPLGNKSQSTFNSVGDLTQITDANGHSSVLTRDSRGNVTSIADPLGNTISFQYDSRDNLIQMVDPMNNTYRYEYDSLDNLVKAKDPTNITDPTRGITTFSYDRFGQLTGLTDARGNTTTFTYDNTGNLTKVRNPIRGTTTYAYDGVGRLASLTDAKGQTFDYTNDGNDRLTQITQPGGATTSYNYACCNLATITDASGTLSFDYDGANRLTRFTNTRSQVIQYGYDPNRNLTALTYPDGKVVRYQYDVANRLKKVTDWLNNTTDYNYDPAGNLISSFNSNGTLAGYKYDAANQLVSLINARSNGTVISGHRYTLNRSGNRTDVASFEPVLPVLSPRNVSATYDDDNRIVTAAGATYTHDADGNLTGISGSNPTTYGYDLFNRLTQVASSGQNAQYQYDGLGNRIVRAVNGSSTKYIVDARGSLSNVLAETDNAGSVSAYYVYGLGLISKVNPTAQTYSYHYDGLGSTIALTDSSGNEVNRYAYDPFGRLSSNSTQTIPNPFRYVGRSGVMDEENGLLYMRARYYAPNVGRFISKDPIGLWGGLNSYTYVSSNPLKWGDPLGLTAFPWAPHPDPEEVAEFALSELQDLIQQRETVQSRLSDRVDICTHNMRAARFLQEDIMHLDRQLFQLDQKMRILEEFLIKFGK